MKLLFLLPILLLTSFNSYADRILIMNAVGYNNAGDELIAAIENNGHIVTVQTTNLSSLPQGFTSRCVDPVNGYDWLCFFGSTDFTVLITPIKNYIDAGGKVYYQYEVGCCTASSESVAQIAAFLTGLPITSGNIPDVAGTFDSNPGYEASGINCCLTLLGNAYKPLEGIPESHQLRATANLNNSSPDINSALDFGFYFATSDFTGTAHQGAFVGTGDVNLWYNGAEPFSNGGTTPVYQEMVDFFFPDSSSSCYLFPPGCIQDFTANSLAIDLGPDSSVCAGQPLILDLHLSNSDLLWSDNSTGPSLTVTESGTYWVTVSNSCGNASDTIIISQAAAPQLTLSDTVICPGETILLDASFPYSTYVWQDGSADSVFSVSMAGTYSVIVTNICSEIADTIEVTEGSCIISVDFPNVFSPGNDGLNDLFAAKDAYGIQNGNMVIYNRWGFKIFETNNLAIGWDGTFNNKPLPEGTYFYVVNYKTIEDESFSKKGFLELIN